MTEKKELFLEIQGRVIDHLGISMYQTPANAIAEIISNAWDADAEKIEIKIPEERISAEQYIIEVKDDGNGMSFEECQKYFLQVGRNRRKALGVEETLHKKRPVLGRKGIGKFAGFGIANIIEIDTTDGDTGERTKFIMDINKLREDTGNSMEKPIEVLECEKPDDARKSKKGTIVTLKKISRTYSINVDKFATSLSLKFLLHQTNHDFKILINSVELPKNFSENFEFVFPRDYEDEEKMDQVVVTDDGWAVEDIGSSGKVSWRVGFMSQPIDREELRGISVFTKDKLSQKPFYFNLFGGISGQHALEYMTGQVRVDFIDDGDVDLIATERQRIDWESDLGRSVESWGQAKIKELASIWKKRRAKKRQQILETKIEGFKDRLNELPSTERKTIKTALLKIASIAAIEEVEFQELATAMLGAWEGGRLRELISTISQSEDIDADKLIQIFAESDILTSLHVAESVKTKIDTIVKLSDLISNRTLENKLRDYIYEHPWLISPEWESYKKETSLKSIIKKIADSVFVGEVYNGRIDMVLHSGNRLLIVEFMRPGLTVDDDHIERFEKYIREVKSKIEISTGVTQMNQQYQIEAGFLIGDTIKSSDSLKEKIKEMEEKKRYVISWDMFLAKSIKQWSEFLTILKERNPDDRRIQNL